MFIAFFIGIIAETNRAPFDLAEAESELVSGFMTEHAAVIFVFFFLAEYASIVLISLFTSILFLGGYLLNYNAFINNILNFYENLYYYIDYCYNSFLNLSYLIYSGHSIFDYNIWKFCFFTKILLYDNFNIEITEYIEKESFSGAIVEGILHAITLNLKTCFLIFGFIWVRASFPRIRFDQLMSFC